MKNAFGGTVNDVAGGGGRRPARLAPAPWRAHALPALRALVPVSMRSEEERGMMGNRLAVVRAPLPVYAQDPVERLRIVREDMAKVKIQGDGRRDPRDAERLAPRRSSRRPRG